MSDRSRLLIAVLASVLFAATLPGAATIRPDNFLCYQAGSTKTLRQSPINGTRVEIRDRLSGLKSFKLRRLASFCNAAVRDGSAVSPSHENVHLDGFTIKPVKGTPKFVPSTQTVIDAFGSHTLV